MAVTEICVANLKKVVKQMPMRKLTKEQEDLIIEGYKNCLPNRVIAEQTGLDYEDIRFYARNLKCTQTREQANKRRKISITHWYAANGLKLGKPYEPL